MSVSGTTTWDPTRNEVINRALRIVGASFNGRSPTATEQANASEALNSLMKSLQAEGTRLWTMSNSTQTLTASSIVDGTDGNVYKCMKSHTSSTDDKPITGGEYTTYWFLSSGTSAAWANATSYNSISDFTMTSDVIGIENAFVREGNLDYGLRIISYEEYMDLNDKTTTGRPTSLAVDWAWSTRTAYLYPTPDLTTYVIHYRAVREIYDAGAEGDTLDIPKLWNEALVFGLAERLSHEYSLDLNERQLLMSRYEQSKARAKGNEYDDVQLKLITPAFIPEVSING